MTRSEILASIERLTKSEPGSLQGPELLQVHGGWDSMCNVEFRMLIEERLTLQLDGLAVEKCQTVDDLIDLLGNAIVDDR